MSEQRQAKTPYQNIYCPRLLNPAQTFTNNKTRNTCSNHLIRANDRIKHLASLFQYLRNSPHRG
jgi:hypothetical protein